MTSDFEEPIVPGRRYTVQQVGPSENFVLDDLLGDSRLLVSADGAHHVLMGLGAAAPFGIRFHEHDPARRGADVRIWRITRDEHLELTAVPEADI